MSRFTKYRSYRFRNPRAGRMVQYAAVEALETRRLLTGTWTALDNPAPMSDGELQDGSLVVQLTDGTVMMEGGHESNAWYHLTPDLNGSYQHGTWSTLTSMREDRIFFGSVVLQSGKVMVLGGEDATDNGVPVSWTSNGEMYDPTAGPGGSWSSIASYPVGTSGGGPGANERGFGDGNLMLLPDGRVLGGGAYGSNTYIYNPSTNHWTTGPSMLNGDQFNEETWAKLPDNSILTYSIRGSQPQRGQRFVPGPTDAQDKWVDAGTVPVTLASYPDQEIGPAVLLPGSGDIFYLGATGHTALYTPPTTPTGTGSWRVGPDIPGQAPSKDTAAAVEPNGKVLFGADGGSGLFEYDPSSNGISSVPAPPGLTVNTGDIRMVPLPSGQVLFSDNSKTLYLYTPDSAPSSAWAPTITNVTNNGDGTYTLTGTQLNGLDEGASYGDDAQMATNYPLVRLTDQSGHVHFARTFNWSNTGVATGNTPETVSFTLPTGLVAGTYQLSVVINGIASPEMNVGLGQLVVSNTNDSGPGSLRAAIQNANANPTTNGIIFNIPGTGVQTIHPLSPLDTLLAPVVIDATTEPGYSGSPLIQLDGTNAGSGAAGLTLSIGNATVKGLAITNFSADGLVLGGSGNLIQNDYIGATPYGVAAGNGGYGIESFASSSTISGNVISGNALDGIVIRGSNNRLTGNYVGTDGRFNDPLPNHRDGIRILGANNVVGGSVAGAGNTIAGNTANGVEISGASATGNVVQGNLIGNFVGNGAAGVLLNAPGNTIGGPASGQGNAIDYNGGAGIAVISPAVSDSLRGNSIFSNGTLGIDLGNDGVTPNSPGGPHSGPNNLQNFPLITSIANGSDTAIAVALNSAANGTFTIDFYSNRPDEPPINEGQTYLGSTILTTDASGNGSAVIHVPLVAAASYITCTATDAASDTSEFSPPVALRASAGLDPDFGTGGLVYTGPVFATAGAVAVQANGQIVVAGSARGFVGLDFALTRLNSTGAVDTTFGTSGTGTVVQNLSTGDDKAIAVVVRNSDQDIYVGGSATVGSITKFGILRYLPNGTLDTSFGSNGIVLTGSPDGLSSGIKAMAVQSDGKLIAVGFDHFALAMARYTNTGQLDTTFGPNGLVTLGGSRFFLTEGFAVAIQPDGRIVVAGNQSSLLFQSGGDILVARYNTNGTLDTAFNGGYVFTDVSGTQSDDSASSVAIQNDGSIVVAGTTDAGASGSGKNFVLARYSFTGALDSGFGTNGIQITDFNGGDDTASGVAIQSDGKILVGGTAFFPGVSEFAVARYDGSGHLDRSFGTTGTGSAFLGGGSAAGMALDGDGRIVIAGSVTIPDAQEFGIARFLPGEYPFQGSPISIPGTIQAEDFDNGSQEVAYHDTTPNVNDDAGQAVQSNYRPGSGVDLETDTDGGNNVHVSYIHAGEWLQYTINVLASGHYGISVRVASAVSGGTFHIEFDGNNLTGPITVSSTGGWLNFQTLTLHSVSLSAGQHLMRVVFDSNAPGFVFVCNLNWIQIAPLAGDLNLDGTVNFSDLLILAQHYGQPGNFRTGDLNGDGTVNFPDLLILAQHYGQSLTSGTTSAEATRSRSGLAGIVNAPASASSAEANPLRSNATSKWRRRRLLQTAMPSANVSMQLIV